MDYGHELEFGAFLTPEAAQLDRLLENALLADVLGLDLVCLQDHPYAAKQADMWTLLSVIGARTTTVRLAPNVACLPLRPPVLLAKAAATLDRVTGGRVELGLGTGAFWDGIVAAGGPRRTPKEAVDALIEAIGIIRGFWAGDPLALEGVHYSAAGLKPGPVPAQQIPIWLGAYKPRMLRVTARLADVWIPSMGYADPPALPALNAAIDAAALAAGRAPESVRRAYNIFGSFGSASGFLKGTPADWAEQLAELTLATGMTTYILGSDDPAALATFAQEVAPAVRV
ncbi:MAG: LLM class flavin-dependent oxidoreductase, partial [Nostocoides sp.]